MTIASRCGCIEETPIAGFRTYCHIHKSALDIEILQLRSERNALVEKIKRLEMALESMIPSAFEMERVASRMLKIALERK